MERRIYKLYGAENPQFGQNLTIFRKCICGVLYFSSNCTKLCNCHCFIELLYHAYRQHDAIKNQNSWGTSRTLMDNGQCVLDVFKCLVLDTRLCVDRRK